MTRSGAAGEFPDFGLSSHSEATGRCEVLPSVCVDLSLSGGHHNIWFAWPLLQHKIKYLQTFFTALEQKANKLMASAIHCCSSAADVASFVGLSSGVAVQHPHAPAYCVLPDKAHNIFVDSCL